MDGGIKTAVPVEERGRSETIVVLLAEEREVEVVVGVEEQGAKVVLLAMDGGIKTAVPVEERDRFNLDLL